MMIKLLIVIMIMMSVFDVRLYRVMMLLQYTAAGLPVFGVGAQ